MILCRSCAAYSQCKLHKKGTAEKCRNYWTHIPTEKFLQAIEQKVNSTTKAIQTGQL